MNEEDEDSLAFTLPIDALCRILEKQAASNRYVLEVFTAHLDFVKAKLRSDQFTPEQKKEFVDHYVQNLMNQVDKWKEMIGIAEKEVLVPQQKWYQNKLKEEDLDDELHDHIVNFISKLEKKIAFLTARFNEQIEELEAHVLGMHSLLGDGVDASTVLKKMML